MLLKFAVKDFIDDRKFKNLSKASITSYQYTLDSFHDFCVEKSILDIEDINPNIIKAFLLHCQKEKGNNPTSINHKIRNLKTFFNYLEKELELFNANANPTKKVKLLKEDVKIEVFSDQQINQMLNYFRRLKYRDKSYYAYRDTAIIVVLIGTGIRLGELVNLKWRDICLSNLTITVYGKKREQNSIPIATKLAKELAEYQVFCQQLFGELPESVFVNKQGKPLTANSVKNIFKRLANIMNFKGVRLSCHTFRHSFAQRYLMSGMDVFTLQKLLRHSDLTMTKKYLALWGTALRDQNDKHNPLNSLEL